jgi:hypothetical protein
MLRSVEQGSVLFPQSLAARVRLVQQQHQQWRQLLLSAITAAAWSGVVMYYKGKGIRKCAQ